MSTTNPSPSPTQRPADGLLPPAGFELLPQDKAKAAELFHWDDEIPGSWRFATKQDYAHKNWPYKTAYFARRAPAPVAQGGALDLARREVDAALRFLPSEYVIQHEDPFAAMVLTFNKMNHALKTYEAALPPTGEAAPTPHAAEAGVRDLANECAEQLLAEGQIRPVANEQSSQMVINAARRTIATILARHRTVAETVVPNATVFACSQCGCDIHFAPFVGCEKCKPVAQLYRAATPPATQSALEQAREALAKAQETLAFLAPYHNAGGIEETLTFVTAAINAVLPPAKGGAQG